MEVFRQIVVISIKVGFVTRLILLIGAHCLNTKIRMTQADMMNLIDMAIGSGVPIYNHGNPRGTVDIC